MDRWVSIILNTLFYGYAVICDWPYRFVDGDYYVIILVIIIALFDIIVRLKDKQFIAIDEAINGIEAEFARHQERR